MQRVFPLLKKDASFDILIISFWAHNISCFFAGGRNLGA
jgi:hypothetical protein